jgi:hypothetical protein
VAGDIGQTHALTPVPFIRIKAGVELPGEKLEEPVEQRCDAIWIKNALDDEEAIGPKLGNRGLIQLTPELGNHLAA